MALCGDEPICPKFQSNIFDPSRCHDCMRQRHLHAGAGENAEGAPQKKSTAETGTGAYTGSGIGSGIGPSKGVLLTPILFQAEERDTSNKDDSDGQSVVSSYCDVNGGQLGYESSSLCILSPDCELYICDGDVDNSTDSCPDQIDYQDLSGSVSTDDDYLPISRFVTHPSMTRLDPPPHRPNPRAWMEEARTRDGFSRPSGLKEEREKRESGYFSLGRAAGARSLRDKSPPPPFRHLERGHPIFNYRNVEPKDIVPFRNPNLGVASERQILELENEDLPVEIPPPDPYEVAVDVEAQVGPRSPSPTPFKIAESLASTGRKGFSASYGRGNLSSHTSSYQQSQHFDSTKLGSALQSRSSSPSRGNLPFGRSESTASVSRRNVDGGVWSQGKEAGPKSSITNARRVESGTLPRNFKSSPSSVKSQTSAASDFRSALRKTEVKESLNGRGRDSKTSSPSRRDYNPVSQTSLRKTEISRSSSHGRGRDSRTSSPSRRTCDSPQSSPNSSPPRRSYNSSSHSLLHKSESTVSEISRSPGGGRDSRTSSPSRRTCDSPQSSPNSSPPRRSYNSSSHSLLHKSESMVSEISRSSSHGRGRDSRTSSPSRRTRDSLQSSPNSSPPRRSYNSSSHSLLHKSESMVSLNGRSHHRRCGSPIREGYDIESQALLRQPKTRNELSDQEHENPTSSSSRPSFDAPTQSRLRKTKSRPLSGSRGHDSRSSSPGRTSHETPSHHQFRKTDTSGSLNSHSRESHVSSPLRRSYDTPSQSLLCKSEKNSSARSHDSHSAFTSKKSYDAPRQPSLQKTETSNSINSRSPNNRTTSPSRKDITDPPGYSVLRNATNGESNQSLQRQNTHDTKSDSPCSWRDSSHRSSSLSHAASPARQTTNGSRIGFVDMKTSRNSSTIRSGSGRRGSQDCCSSTVDKRSSQRARSPSPSPQINIQRHTSSQSSMESSESGRMSVGSTGRNKEEYATMADVPKVRIVYQTDGPGQTGRPQNHQPSRRQELFKPASHSLSKHPSRDWEDTGDTDREHTGWQYGGGGHLSRAHSSTSLQRSGSPTAEESSSWKGNHHRAEQMQPDLLNFKKGWMSKLDESGEWKKHWFVLTDAGLRYYRDSGAEEKDDLDGEIDLKSCVKVSEFDVEKNYGFQIQTQEAVFTLSAMTAGIRRNWIEVLKKCVRPSSSPDLTLLPDSSSDKENSHTRSLLSSRRPSSRHGDVQSEVLTSPPSTQHRLDYVELSPVPASSSPLPASQREAGEGHSHSQWQEERNRDATSSQWEALLSRKSTGIGSNQRLRTEDEIEKRWTEFERIPLKEMRSLPPMGTRTSSQPANEALQREVASLRQQLEKLQRGGGGGVIGGCGPEASCGRSLLAMERAHRQALEELQKQHDRQIRELETERDRLLQEETQATAQVMEALKKVHKDELESEMEKVRRLSGMVDSQTVQSQQQAETQTLQRDLAGLSERYSQKCLELNRAEQSNAEREREISRKERDMEQLKKENQDLKHRLMVEIRGTHSTIISKGSDDRSDRMPCELEVLLRVKENEVDYLHKEISCLRNELQFLNTEKRLACKRYKEVHEELCGIKGRSEREIQSLKEHLRLAMAALQEGQTLGNSLDH